MGELQIKVKLRITRQSLPLLSLIYSGSVSFGNGQHYILFTLWPVDTSGQSVEHFLYNILNSLFFQTLFI